ncbi:MAG: hypothetical protein QG566_469 [Patescibacteria group bacterium]|nr:hypothetical protein [Patescibacteria group bacterium]
MLIISILVILFFLYALIVYPIRVRKTCSRAADTFSSDYRETFYRNCVSESGLKP